MAPVSGAKDRARTLGGAHLADLSHLRDPTVCGIAVEVGPHHQAAMNTPQRCWRSAVLYIRLCFWRRAVPCSGGNIWPAGRILNAALQLQAEPALPGRCLSPNIVLDLVLIAGCRMGVAVAIATDISASWCPSSLPCAFWMWWRTITVRDGKGSARAQKDLWSVSSTRWPARTGIQNMVISLSNVLVQVKITAAALLWQVAAHI